MPHPVRVDLTASREFGVGPHLEMIAPALNAARDEVFADVQLLKSGDPVPQKKQPLDAGFIRLPEELLAARDREGDGSLLSRIEASAAELREQIDRLVVLGIGGSYMGARALFEALCHPYHNELARDERRQIPRLYFEGNNVDNDAITALLELLKQHCADPNDVLQRWGIVVISKSGGTLETALAFRVFREALESYYGRDHELSRKLVVPVTGETGKLRSLANVTQYPATFPIPDGVGGRFSVFTAVGLLPAAILGIDIQQLLQGAADMTELFRNEPLGNNPVLDYTANCHVMESRFGKPVRVLSTWGAQLEAVGLWYDQLLSESLGKHERGATPITVVNTRDLHSRGQQHQEGTQDKLITNLYAEACNRPPLAIPESDRDQDDLNCLASKTVPNVLTAARQGTNQAYADVGRPTADIVLPKIDAYRLGQLLQMLMLATVLEGRLIDINPYGQPGVEAYKQNMGRILGR